MTVCQDPWASVDKIDTSRPIDVEERSRRYKGRYLVPIRRSAATETLAHIVSGAIWGDESPGGSCDLDLTTYCRSGRDDLAGTTTLEKVLPAGVPVCRSCQAAKLREDTIAGLTPDQRRVLGNGGPHP